MADLIMDSPFKTIDPLFVYFDRGNVNMLNIRLKESKPTDQSLAEIGGIFKKYNPEYPFEYQFVDEEYAKKYGDEQRIGRLALVFAILAIFISCLGLFGLASFVAEQRTKEIGIRKVLGASVASIVALFSKAFFKLVLVSVIIASPIAYYFMDKWLQDFAYRIPISWSIFGYTALIIMLTSFVTISYQGIKAALINPVDSLRSE